MPFYKEFPITNKDIRRIRTVIHHKIRYAIGCYTINEFVMPEGETTFQFKRTVRRKGIKVQDKQIFTGNYELEQIDEKKYVLKIFVN